MSHEYLATGFANVDARDDITAYKRCLSLLDSLPYFHDYKHRSYELLDLYPGLSLLEVGCGLGDDVFRIARRVAWEGLIVGVDASTRMVEEAAARAPVNLCVQFGQADARYLPFKEKSFDRCRVDRTLQHISDPRKVISEMARVLKPGGVLLAYDNDWGTFSVTGSDDELTRIVETAWADSFTNRWIGRYLKRYFIEAGLENVIVEPSVSVVTDFDLADRIYNLRETVRLAVSAGRLSLPAAREWVAGLEVQSQADLFLCTLTAFTVTGMKP